jgi:succinoglycan biosynthesis transport protein ExoP
MTQIEMPARPHAGDEPDPDLGAAPSARPAPPLLDLPRGLRRFWWLILGLALLLGAAGVYVGSKRGATYTAAASVNVGRVDIRSQALPGYMSAAQALASSYSRVATGDRAAAAIGARLHLSPQTVADRLTAAPVPKAPIFTIIARGPSAAAAIGLANAATNQITRYVSSTNAGDAAATGILNAYRKEARRAASLKLEIQRLRGQGSPQHTISRTQLALQTSRVRLQGLSTQYQAQSQEVLSTAGIEVLNRPTRALSNHTKTIKQYGGAGAVAGLLLGVALALGLERLTTRRRRRTA